ncbi:hypothetical protein MPTK1_2g09630 [Marchantia polymorpha subsp. ruderalis]|uniref:PDZ domain-containing protein n=2 Tax=Marchantia polymorpha TaxID=3197 RepID=A0A176WN46_MARPO|nr:hypothetical protein AXG93_601s1100 [Marchantia polymorpha subsp. ruderalis]PTQ28657.1 hypothetical protein MARPO_0158s0034 [Marchantia polymorpha]BBN01704.1 hypothetical protein Mp_2g09630 [Marchantia polymorpha subsp. ruderalis]|eukprot:PTQ28657.1 hypothetical protein MARPO_0158s0034 [Marchantia polymorpha]
MAAASCSYLLPAHCSSILPASACNGSAHFKHRRVSASQSYAPAILLSAKGYRINVRSTKVRVPYSCPRALIDSDQASSAEGSDLPPPGCSRVKVELSRPLGIAFEETKTGTVVVGEVISGGNAQNSGLVEVGDQLIATSAVVYSDTDEYQGVTVRKGMQIVRLNVRGERFETVMAAIGTHPAYIKVVLELQKCQPVTTNGAANGAVQKN